MDAFLDTEWADPEANELVSIAIVSADERHIFYAEVDELPPAPTDFVACNVYPQLQRGSAAFSRNELADALRRFVIAADVTRVLCDHPADRGFFLALLEEAATPGQRLPEVAVELVSDPVLRLLVEDYFVAHSDAAAGRHNALVDARVLVAAWRARTGRAPAPWSLSASQIAPNSSTF